MNDDNTKQTESASVYFHSGDDIDIDVVLENKECPNEPPSPSLLALLEYERDRIQNPTKPASLPRPGSKLPPTEPTR